MRSSNDEVGGRTFTNAARREQIVACAIEVIAQDGYGQTSIRKIAQRLGLAMSVVLYHVASKDELVAAIVQRLYRSAIATMTPAVQAEDSAAGKLAAYIRANARYVAEHRDEHLALLELGANYRSSDGKRLWELPLDPALLAELAVFDLDAILTAGQRAKQFRRMDIHAMTLAIRGALNGSTLELATNPDFDVVGYGEQLVTAFDLATRRSSS